MTVQKKNLKQNENWRTKDFWPSDFETSQLQTATFCLERDGQVYRHKHAREDNLWYIVSGRGWVLIDDEEHAVEEGDAILIPAGTFHAARTDSRDRMRILQVECIVHSKPRPAKASPETPA